MSATPKTQFGYGYNINHKKIQKFNNLPIPKVGPNEILLKIEAAGLCLSDPHTLIAGPLPQQPPLKNKEKFIMGHEIAGSVYEIGSEIEKNLKNTNNKYQKGKRFALQINYCCGHCEFCRIGLDGSCSSTNQAYGLNEDGGFQQYLLIKNLRTLLPIPDNVSFEDAAVCTDSVLTPFHAIQKVKHKIQPTSKILVQGCGGLGLNAIQILKNYGCFIVATDKKEDIKSTALSYGANEFYNDIEEDSNHESQSFDIIFDFVGIQQTVDISNNYLKKRGTLSMIGLGKFQLILPNFLFAVREIEVIYNFGGNSIEQIECMKWISKGLIKPNVTIVDFNKLPDALEDLINDKVRGRVVFRPNKL
ncbi:uncharacterized protein KGF55_000671 [Candida pseudojiufengensis]|uniref:uncharacterized protein n=1 Tax=Candida pseudojiufengensis TaxID=497109 RepID=UPI0022255D58|nr:uncharacterized protein KGF55_000671 [Candida pseudojiufengensis]KAI5966362.1 hypothetical protein KGF55_000671 [Candida pseudojiufengensis]